MNYINKISKIKALAITSFIMTLVAVQFPVVGNASKAVEKLAKDESINIAAKSLSNKLKSDLVSKTVSVKFTKAEQYIVSDSEVGLRGEGTCRIDGDASELPINFDVKIDVAKRSAEDVRYVFLNMAADEGLTVEDVVTEKLLQKMKNDFKTENVVLAIDYISDETSVAGDKGFIGSGEVRLNGMVWKKINFEAKAGQEKTDVSIVKYQVK